MASAHSEPADVPVVAIGSSAGGIVPVGELIAAIGAAPLFAIVVAQHLSASRDSSLVQIFQRSSAVKVKTIDDGEFVQAGVVYVTPPGFDVCCARGQLRLKLPEKRIVPFPSVDTLFESLANAPGRYPAIGIILSGLGRDGERGVRALSRRGGVILVQTLREAQSAGMPEAALRSSCVDLVATAATLGARLPMICKSLLSNGAQVRAAEFNAVCAFAEPLLGIGLDRFDPLVLGQALRRRAALLGADSVMDYAEQVAEHPAESDALLRYILKPAGSFDSQNPERRQMIEALLACYQKYEGAQPFRAWSMGCATGEETYAMVFALEAASKQRDKAPDFLVYGTDLRPDCISLARTGSYSDYEVAHLPKSTMTQCMVPHLRFHTVKRELRRKTLFAVHDALLQNPLQDMQFVACIGVMPILSGHHASVLRARLSLSLVPGGVLFSESDLESC